MAAKKRDSLRISQVAKAAGLTVHQVRDYLDRRLLKCAGRSSCEHRLFDDSSIARLKLIKAGIVAGLSLHELTPFIHVLEDSNESQFNFEKQKLVARVEQHLVELKVFKTILIQQ
jgi:MerR family transcriptional regulator, mercuric resistance operon regulatory protein